MKRILFIGTFNSSILGTKDVCETISSFLVKNGYSIKLVSYKKSILSKFLDICLAILFSKKCIVHFNVFSGLAFSYTEFGSWLAEKRGFKVIYTLH